MRVGEILTRWPQTVDVFVGHGFASLANPEHREQVKQIPVTLRMACQRHNVDLDYMVVRTERDDFPRAAEGGGRDESRSGERGKEGETHQGGDDRGGPHPGRDPRGVPRDGEGVPEILRRRLLLLPRAGDGVGEAERDDAQCEARSSSSRSSTAPRGSELRATFEKYGNVSKERSRKALRLRAHPSAAPPRRAGLRSWLAVR